MDQLSILLGAGFSVNKGYPTAGQLNNKVTNLKESEFCISTGGSVCFLEKDQKGPFWYSSYYKNKKFTLEFISFYTLKKMFNYEEFYDYYQDLYRSITIDADFNEFCEMFREKYHCKTDNHNLLSQHDITFNQIISAFLVDGEGKKYYDQVHLGKPYLSWV